MGNDTLRHWDQERDAAGLDAPGPLHFRRLQAKNTMPTQQQDQVKSRVLESDHDLEETRLEAIGFIFHGHPASGNGKSAPVKSSVNLLHFARCPKLDKAGGSETKIWFRSIRVAKAELDEAVGANRWKWCKSCEREVTQRILNEL
jgi:hypothetical protein